MNANPASEDLYERLGVAPDATPEQIRAAFKAMRKELHPDGRPEALRAHFDGLMQNVNEAHQTLSDPGLRSRYDSKRQAASAAREDEAEAAWGEWEREQEEQAEPKARRQRQEEERREEHEARERRRRRAEEEAARQEEDEWYWSEEEHERRVPPQPEPAGGAGWRAALRRPGTIAPSLPPMVNLLGAVACSCLVWSLEVLLLVGLEMRFFAVVFALGTPILGFGMLRVAGLVSATGRALGAVMFGGPVLAFALGLGPLSFLAPPLMFGGVAWAGLWALALVLGSRSV